MDYLYALQCLREAGPEFINYIFLFISETFFLGGVVFACYVYWCVDKYAGRAILIGYGASVFVNQTVKNVACIYRPWILDARLHVYPGAAGSATGYSFPSGHTVSAASVFGGISIWQHKRRWVVVLMSVFIVLVAFSRNWLGAHTMKDVVVAVIVGAVVLAICAFLKYLLYCKPHLDTLICFGGIALAAVILLILNLKLYPIDCGPDGKILVDPFNMLTDCYTATGVMIGGLLGMWLERHYLQFENSKSKDFNVKVSFAGFVGVACLYFILTYVLSFLGEHWSHFVKYFIIFLVIIYVYPVIFTYVRRCRS